MWGKRYRYIYQIISIIFFIIISLSISVTAEEYQLTVVNTDYTKLEEENIAQEVVITYDIQITLSNRGNATSDEIAIKLTDDEGFSVSKEYIFDPMETKVFTFEDYPLSGAINHNVTLTYAPTNSSIQKTNANSGAELITISYKNDSKYNTPYLNPLFFICTIFFVSFLLKKKK